MQDQARADEGSSGQKVSLLLVDDQPSNLLALKAILADLGANLVLAHSGEEGLRQLLQEEFAVVLLDVQMHDLDGFETARLIRSREKSRHTPIIFLTAYDDHRFPVEQAYALGAVDYLVKPVVPLILQAKVTGFIDLFEKTERVKKLNEELEQRVSERTADLAKANEELRREIAVRQRAEEALRESEMRLRAVLHSVPDAIVSTDSRGKIIGWNKGAQTIFGYAEGEVLGKPLTFLMPEDYRDTESLQSGGEPRVIGKTVELHGQRKDGSEFPLELSLAAWETDKSRFYTAILRDILERKRLEEQFRQAQKMEAVGRLAGGIAHDFNNLLTVVTGYSSFMLGSLRSGHPLHTYAEQIKHASDRATGLTRQLLAFSRAQVLQPEVLDFNALVTDMEKMLRRLIGEDIDLKVSPQRQLWPVKVDRGQTEQVIMNLVVNARDAMPQGGKLTIETRNVELDESYARQHVESRPGPHVLLAVSDTGCGMDAATMARVFEPFFTTKGTEKGTGLGLATVYGIVKQSGGHIGVYSEPGRGTTFKIYLPRVKQGVPARKSAPGVAVSLRGAETVLLVEDEQAVRSLARIVLEKHGYKVLEARNGGDALLVADRFEGPIHLMVTDVVMPEMSGRQLADRLASLRAGMKVLYVSGYTDDAIVHHGVLESDMPFLHKPFTPDSLARKVRELLDTKPGAIEVSSD